MKLTLAVAAIALAFSSANVHASRRPLPPSGAGVVVPPPPAGPVVSSLPTG